MVLAAILRIANAGYEAHKGTMILSELIQEQNRKTKNKVYSLYASEVECIGKGKAHRPNVIGVKVSLVVTHKEGSVWASRPVLATFRRTHA